MWLRCMILWFFFINLGDFILPTSIHLLAHGSSGWQAYFIYLSPKSVWKDSTNKMHEVWILDVYKNVPKTNACILSLNFI